MSTIVDMRTAIVAGVRAALPTLITCETHAGRFDLEALKRIATRAPAVVVACLGLPKVQSEGGAIPTGIRWAAFVITRDAPQLKRDVAALAIVEEIAKLIPGNRWGISDAHAPTSIRADNLYSGDVDRTGVALWAFVWDQAADLPGIDASSLSDLNKVVANYDLAPADGVVDAEDAVQLQGTFMSAYGDLNITTPVATAIAAADTYQKAAGTTALNLAADCDMPVTGRLRHIGTVAKPFLATAAVSISVDADAKVTLALAKNGVADDDTAIEQEVTATGGPEAFSLKAIMSLDTNEHVEIWVKADDTINVTLTKAKLVLAAT